jgi:hypothetical protein
VTISSPGAPELQFLANRWLATDEADGQTYCTLYPSTGPSSAPRPHKYRVTVTTSDVRGAGTDARVFITLFGSGGAAAGAAWLHAGSAASSLVAMLVHALTQSSRAGARPLSPGLSTPLLPGGGAVPVGPLWLDSSRDNFRRGAEDVFHFELPNLGEVGSRQRMQQHTCRTVCANAMWRRAWWNALVSPAAVICRCARWRSGTTAAAWRPAGAASRWCCRTTPPACARPSPATGTARPQAHRPDSEAVDCGTPPGADAEALAYLACPHAACRWLAKDEDDGAIRRRLQALGSPGSAGLTATTTYRVTIYTSDVRGAGTDANVYVQLLGELQDGRQVRGSSFAGVASVVG